MSVIYKVIEFVLRNFCLKDLYWPNNSLCSCPAAQLLQTFSGFRKPLIKWRADGSTVNLIYLDFIKVSDTGKHWLLIANAYYSKLGRTRIKSRTSQVSAKSTLSTRLGRNCPRLDFGPNPGFPRRQWFGRWVDLSSPHLRWKFQTYLPHNHCNSVQISFDANTTFCKFSLFCHIRSRILKFARYPAYSNASSTSQL